MRRWLTCVVFVAFHTFLAILRLCRTQHGGRIPSDRHDVCAPVCVVLRACESLRNPTPALPHDAHESCSAGQKRTRIVRAVKVTIAEPVKIKNLTLLSKGACIRVLLLTKSSVTPWENLVMKTKGHFVRMTFQDADVFPVGWATDATRYAPPV